MDTLLHQQYLLYLQAEEEVAGKCEDFDKPFLSKLTVAGFSEDKERSRG